jgi:hypothetical protein
MSDARLPVVLSINLEPDDRVTTNDGTSPWDGTQPTIDLVEAWRTGHDDRTVSWLWRCDPAIDVGYGDAAWALRRWNHQIEAALARGDIVGVHSHYWRWSDALGTFVSDAADGDWKAQCIRKSVETMRSETSSPATVVMMGDGYVDAASARTLDELGVEIDLTLEPGGEPREKMVHTEYTTGSMPDRRRTPHRPFRPSPGNPLRPGRLRRARHWALPLTTTTTPVTSDGVIIDRAGIPANLGLDPWRFRLIVASGLAASVEAGAPYVQAVVRSDVGVNAGLAAYTTENLQWLADGMGGLADDWDGVAFTTPQQALEMLGGRR